MTRGASFSSEELVAALRAAGEPTRLRLLALCNASEQSVSALAELLGQSEPRVSKHLKQLCEAGILERLQAGAWVRYRVPPAGREHELVGELLAGWAADDPLRLRDAERAQERAEREGAAGAPAAESRLGRSLQRFIAADAPAEPVGRLLLAGPTAVQLLPVAGQIARRITVLAGSRIDAQRLRALAERSGLDCEVPVADLARAPTLARLLERLPLFDAVIADRLGADAMQTALVLRALAPRLAGGGCLWLFVRYDALEQGRGKVVEHPLARVRRLLAQAGLACRRLQPIEAEGEHVIAAAASGENIQERVA